MPDQNVSTSRQVGQPGGNVVLDVFVLNQRIGALLESVLAGHGITPPEYAVYSQLDVAPLTPSQLSRRLGVKASTLSGHLNALQRRGHTERVVDPQDRRSYRLELTTDGRQLLKQCQPLIRQVVQRLNRRLEADVADVRAVLAAIDEAAAQVTPS
ncbi:MAG TPA: MarR family transcriptional regulator [Nocardioidaceae bacterium]|jgi:DNA-binding MarR family transcriptional regulator